MPLYSYAYQRRVYDLVVVIVIYSAWCHSYLLNDFVRIDGLNGRCYVYPTFIIMYIQYIVT